jgi:hypothetical protein
MVEGELVPNSDAARVQEVFRLRAHGQSYRVIEDHTGIKYSTVCAILASRVYLGEVVLNGVWYQGHHEALVTEEVWRAAHRGFGKSVQPSTDVLRSRVRCGLCGNRMTVAQNGKGSTFYRCWHRGQGCDQPARSTKGLSRAAVLGMSLLGHDDGLQGAIRRRLAGGTRAAHGGARRDRRDSAAQTLGGLSERRRKLLELFYTGKISADGFKEEEDRLMAATEAARALANEENVETRTQNELEQRFEQVALILANLDIKSVWKAAEDRERRVLVEELIEWVTIFPDHLEVTVAGAPPLNVLFEEVGLKGSEIVGVGGPTRTRTRTN